MRLARSKRRIFGPTNSAEGRSGHRAARGVGMVGRTPRPRVDSRRWIHGRSRKCPAAQGAGAHGRGEPQPPHGHRRRVDAPRVRALEPRTGLRRPGRRPLGGRPVAAVPDRPYGARGQPAHRGQPAELPPRDRPRLRQRQRLGHLGQPVDGRGGSARVLHPRLPPRHPRGRSRRAGAGADGDDGDGLRGDGEVRAQRLRLRVVPGAGDPRLAPQHRALHRGADRGEAARAASPRTRTCT